VRLNAGESSEDSLDQAERAVGGPTITGRRYWYQRQVERALAEREEPMLWVLYRSTAILCLVLTFFAGFFVGAAILAALAL
jgi:hypothetical protein